MRVFGALRQGGGTAMNKTNGALNKGLLWALGAYVVASSFHHLHNASFLTAYPNMPPQLSTLGVYAAWAAVSMLGLAGYLLVRKGYTGPGLLMLAIYGACGLDGLAHYAVAEFSAHTTMMHSTILLEVVTGLLLIGACARTGFKTKEPGALSPH
jgi:hypothetical protein